MKKYTLDWNNYIDLAVKASAEGAVLLKNDNDVLPVRDDETLAVFGRCAIDYFKSGTGSGGMVNVNHTTNIIEALRECDVLIDEDLVSVYDEWIEANKPEDSLGWGNEPWSNPEMELEDSLIERFTSNDKALVVIGRTAGEDNDSGMEQGSYLLTDAEMDMLRLVRKNFDKMAVVLNVGNIIDMNWMDEIKPDSVMYIWHGGMVGALGSAQVICGKVSPSGKLPDTIAYNIEDYPSHANFGKDLEDIYVEDIFVGYRYFETFKPEAVRYPFGFGLSYTDFEFSNVSVEANLESRKSKIQVTVKNTGDVAGKEVVQVYVEAPNGKLGKAKKVLAGFAKTGTIQPKKSDMLEIVVDFSTFMSYDEENLKWVLEKGQYSVYVGSDVRSAKREGGFLLVEDMFFGKTLDLLAPVQQFEKWVRVDGEDTPVLKPVVTAVGDMYDRRKENIPEKLTPYGDVGIKIGEVIDGTYSIEDFVSQFTDKELASIVRGEGMGSSQVAAGTAAAFGGVTPSLKEKGLVAICCDDGPSGMRLDCGAKAFSLPIGTLLACTFNRDLVRDLYECLAIEMLGNNVECLLGPGINIHRHPLNGRNFEYFSEDPYLTAEMAGAQLLSLHKYGVEGVIKHFAANNRETKRREMDSVVSMRALREIYLKAFEICVKKYKASAIMTTYGSLNGVWTSGNYDLNTALLRDEWGFEGIVMTDWWAAINRRGEKQNFTDFAAMVEAGNDLYMVTPDSNKNIHGDNTLEALASGELKRSEIQRCAINICKWVMNSTAMNRPVVEIINRPKDADDVDLSELVYEFLGDEKELDFSDVTIKSGTNLVFPMEVEGPAVYEMTITVNSDLNPVAQLPTSLYENGILMQQFVFNGSEGKDTSITKLVAIPRRFAVFRLFVREAGMTVKSIKLVKTGDDPFKLLGWG